MKFDVDGRVVRPAKKIWAGSRRAVGRFASVLEVGGRQERGNGNDGDDASRFEEGGGRLPVAEAEEVNVGEREPLLRG